MKFRLLMNRIMILTMKIMEMIMQTLIIRKMTPMRGMFRKTELMMGKAQTTLFQLGS
jgi:hypothetical protein